MKLEAGKTYRLVDKKGYLDSDNSNQHFLDTCFGGDCITISTVTNTGSGNHKSRPQSAVIHYSEIKYFELVEDADNNSYLTKLDKPFGGLDNKTKKDLLCAWVDGDEIERSEYFGGKWFREYTPRWTEIFSYRVKPTTSDEDAAKGKLISEAQQKLKDAQEALAKLQSL